MAFRTFERGIDGLGVDQAQVSRRALLRGGALAGAGALLAGLPMGRAALAHGHAAGGMHAPMPGMAWPGVTKEVTGYVADGKVANMVATFGWGTSDTLQTVGGGKLTIGQPAMADADSLYRIYSMTKPVTGMAAMMLIEDGKLGLDQPLADILPAYANMTVQKTYDGSITDVVPAERPITIRQLLTHTAGLGYGIIQQGPIKDEYERLGLVPGQVSRIPIPGIGRSKPVEGLANFADRLAEVPLVYQPGTKWSYSVSLDLLGRVIEVASGVDFATFLQDNIFTPAGMDSTYFQVPRSEVGRFTTNYGILNGTPLAGRSGGGVDLSRRACIPVRRGRAGQQPARLRPFPADAAGLRKDRRYARHGRTGRARGYARHPALHRGDSGNVDRGAGLRCWRPRHGRRVRLGRCGWNGCLCRLQERAARAALHAVHAERFLSYPECVSRSRPRRSCCHDGRCIVW